MFGSTNVCQHFFPSMRNNKSALRSRVTNEHLQVTPRVISTDKLKTNIEKLADAKRCQLSSQKKIIVGLMPISFILVSTHFR